MGGIASTLSSLGGDLLSKAKPLADKAMNYMATSGYEALNKLGPAGEFISNTLRDQGTAEANSSGSFVSQLKNIWDGTPANIRSAASSNPSVAQTQWSKTQALVASQMSELSARGAKVVTGGSRVPIYQPPDFFPKVPVNDIYKPGQAQDDVINHLMTTNQVSNRGEAEDIISKLSGIQNSRKGIEAQHDLFGLQIPPQYLEKDPQIAFSKWGQSASAYITKHDYYGPNNSFLDTAVNSILATNGKNARDFAMDAVNSHEYGYIYPQSKFYEGKTPWEDVIRNFEGLTKLGRIAIPHSTQSLNTLLLTNMGSMVNSLKDVFSDPGQAKDFALRSGALLSSTVKDFTDEVHGSPSWLDSMLKYTGFNLERKFNLVLSANAGKYYARDLTDKLLSNPADPEANLFLKQLGLEPSAILRKGVLAPEDELTAARRTAELTQFFNNPLDMPIQWTKNPWMRTMFLYKNFAFNQGKFIKDQIKNDIMGGKLENLAYLGILFPAAGEMINLAGSAARGRDSDSENQNGLERYAKDISEVGAGGIFASMLSSLNHGNLLHWMFGPAAGDMEDFALAGKKMIKDGDWEEMKKEIATRVPVIGSLLKNKVVGQ